MFHNEYLVQGNNKKVAKEKCLKLSGWKITLTGDLTVQIYPEVEDFWGPRNNLPEAFLTP